MQSFHHPQLVAVPPVNGNFTDVSSFDPATFSTNGFVIPFSVNNITLLITNLAASAMYAIRYVTNTSNGLVTSDTVIVSTTSGLLTADVRLLLLISSFIQKQSTRSALNSMQCSVWYLGPLSIKQQ